MKGHKNRPVHRGWKMSVSLWICFLVFAAVIALAFWLILIDSVQNQYRRREISKLDQTAWTVVEKYGQEDFETALPVLARSDSYFIQLISEQDGRRLLSMDNEGNAAPPQQSDIAGADLFEQLSDSDGYLFYYVDDKVHNSQWAVWAIVIARVDGWREALVISKSMAYVDTLLRMLFSRAVMIVTAVMVIAAIIAVFMANIYVKPIEKLNQKATLMAAGDYQVQFPREGPLEIVQLSESLTKARDEFEATEALRRDFIANISHDMKTPLTVIKAYAEMLKSYSCEIPQKREEHLNIIMNETDKLAALINDTMELARLQSGAVVLAPELFDLCDVAAETLDRFCVRPDLEAFTFSLHAHRPFYVRADRKLMERVFYNLVNNGVKFSREECDVAIDISAEDGKVLVKVIDHGIGIEKDQLDNIWERFYQIMPYEKEKAGMGMGLNIVYQILRLHQVDFGADSTPGEGTVIWFALEEAAYEA